MKAEHKIVQFVIKTSKHCNLRCKYCYEYAELGNKQVVEISQLEMMFKNILSHYQGIDLYTHIEFVWHGGEPLLQNPDFYWQVFDIQNKIFENFRGKITNGVQTNLTLLDTKRLHLLKEGFDSVGVSLDLFGGLRVHQTGIESQSKVLENIDRLTAANLEVGCITVLTKKNIDHVAEIYQFYREMKMSVRILPLFYGAFENQHQGFEIDAHDVLSAYKKFVDLWLEDDEFVAITPIYDAIQQVVYYYSPNAPTVFYDKREWESVYIVDLDGEVYSYSDAYDIDCSHGNIFTTPLENIVGGSAHQKVLGTAEQRMIAVCGECKFFGSCSGYPIAEGSRDYNTLSELDPNRCIVERGLLEYIEYRFIESGIIDVETGTIATNKISLGELNSPGLAYV
jgi:uncharacterized protein